MRILLAALLSIAAAAEAAPQLDPLFTDHAVLQRARPIHVTGTAAPGERISVRLGPRSATARAGSNGAWRATLPAMQAGGPYGLVATGAEGVEAVASDVMIGDVWLCSGQSNMEFPMRRALNSDSDIGGASDAGIRMLTVTQRTSLTPLDRFPVAPSWTPVSPQSVAEFSAACYLMARELRRTRDVPLGLIDASWGGTRARAWMSPDSIPAGSDADLLALYRSDEAAAQRRFGEEWQAWWRASTGQQPGAEPWTVPDRLQWRPFPNVGFWERWGDPALASYNGLLWARRTVTLTPAQASQPATLALGAIDEMDQTFVNGVPVGNTFGWDVQRSYRLPAGTLQAGANEILVAASDSYGNGGFVGPADRLKLVLADGTDLPLGDGWRYAMPPPDLPAPPRTPWDRAGGVSVIHNAMVAPLGDFGLRGVAWYQGESDVGIPGYADRLAGLMSGWRRQFGNRELPFLIIGLANYGPQQTAPTASGWADIREQQRLAAARDDNAALVVAMDLGDRLDIHPGNKQEVGRRLARAAEARAYASKQPVGPEVARARRTGDAIVVSFTGVTGTLGTWSGSRALAFELCDDTQESCRFADATATGSTVRIADDGRPATRVRYAWADSPVTNLYDEAPLPVGPFEVPIAN